MSRPSPILQLLQSAAGAHDVVLPVHLDVVRAWYNLEQLRTFHPERFRVAAQFIERLMEDEPEPPAR